MLMIKITHKDTGNTVSIPAASFADYCTEHNWSHNCAKAAIGTRTHYEKHYLTIVDVEEPVKTTKKK